MKKRLKRHTFRKSHQFFNRIKRYFHKFRLKCNFLQTKSSEKLRLSGYDVELQMKSTEYKVQDDSQVDDTKSPSEDNTSILDDDDDDENDYLEGFRFSKLKYFYFKYKVINSNLPLNSKIRCFFNRIIDNNVKAAYFFLQTEFVSGSG